PHRRGFGLMFQDYALFPHRNVFDNVAFGLKMQRMSRSEIWARVHALLENVGLAGQHGRDVNTLSGGEQQRVALARALAPGPRLLMLDEPLGALDRNLRDDLLDELLAVLAAQELAAIYVTHDQEEAFAVAGRVAIMRAGRIEQAGTPQALYARPATEFVARFLGMRNIVAGTLENRSGQPGVRVPFGWLPLAEPLTPGPANGDVRVLLQPGGATFAGSGAGFPVAVLDTTFHGSRTVVDVQPEAGRSLRFEVASNVSVPARGARSVLRIDPRAVICLPEEAHSGYNS
ncbi:MAG: ABC transporter ATP-binding protein, partial [Anaerolineales bacterium]